MRTDSVLILIVVAAATVAIVYFIAQGMIEENMIQALQNAANS